VKWIENERLQLNRSSWSKKNVKSGVGGRRESGALESDPSPTVRKVLDLLCNADASCLSRNLQDEAGNGRLMHHFAMTARGIETKQEALAGQERIR